ncbi:hypothetical protein SLS61_004143 [Didymella pomorum]
MSTSRYKYAPLDPMKKEIRLLHANKNLDWKLCAYSLHGMFLNEKPEYIALTYCWVQFMRKIQNTAADVIIWLGQSTRATDAFLYGVNELSKELLATGFWDLTLQKQNGLLALMSTRIEGMDTDAARDSTRRSMKSHLASARQDQHPFEWVSIKLSAFDREKWSFHACGQGECLTPAVKINTVNMLSHSLVLQGILVDTIYEIEFVFSLAVDQQPKADFWQSLRPFFCTISLPESDMYTSKQKAEAEWRIPIGDGHIDSLTSEIVRASSVNDSHMRVGYK